MTSGHEIRDEQAERRQAIADRFIEFAEKHPEVTAAARRDAETLVRQQQAEDFEKAVSAAIEQQAADAAATTTEE